MSLLRPIWLNLVILAAIGLQSNAVFAQVFNGLQRPAGSSVSTAGPHHFTIIGHIARPNCYELPTASPSLITFVEFAGELTRDAAGPIRIVRDGRTVQSTFYSETSTVRLLPGDVVVVDGKINQGRVIVRGNQNGADRGNSPVNLAIMGIRDYPVVMTIPSERATVRWVTRQLGLDPQVAQHVKVVAQRQSAAFYPDSRLASGTVLVFQPSHVDPSRLPDDLPLPVKAGRRNAVVAQPLVPTAPLVQQPLSGQQPPNGAAAGQYGAAPGRARVPQLTAEFPAVESQADPPALDPEEQKFVKQLLTDPASVPLDEPTPEVSGRAFVRAPRTTAGPSGSSSVRNETPVESPSTDAASSGATSSDSSNATEEITPVEKDRSPEAPRPYESVPAAPEPLQPLGSSSQSIQDESPTETDAGSKSGNETTSPRNLAESAAGGAGFSLAMQGAGMAAATPPGEIEASADRSGGPPSGGLNEVPVVPAGPVPPGSAGARATADSSAKEMASSQGSRLLPPRPTDLNWPVISILTVGFLGAVAAAFLIYSIANETPQPRTAKIDTSGRYWLDRMIENDIPIVEENVDYPHRKQLFGKPAPIQRIDAGHTSVPRPHFSMPGGKSGVLKENPAVPDAPSPDISGADSDRIVRVHSGRSHMQQKAASIPEPHTSRPAVKPQHEELESNTAAESSTPSSSQPSGVLKDESRKPVNAGKRSFRVDSGGEDNSRQLRADSDQQATDETSESTSTKRGESLAGPEFLKKSHRHRNPSDPESVQVQPSPVVVQGANLLDRILSSVERNPAATKQQAAVEQSEVRQRDERGNS